MSQKVINALTAAGAPFEFVEAEVQGRDCRVFKNATPCLSQLYSVLDTFAEADLAVYDSRRLSYAQAKTNAAALAKHLKAEHQIGVGDRVAIIMRNSPEWLLTFIALTSLGAVPALVNSRGSADEIAYSASTTPCALLIVDDKTLTLLSDQDIKHKAKVVFDLNAEFSAINDQGESIVFDTNSSLPQVVVDQDEVALILFTSGTTGRPKGALLSHRGVLNALKANEFSSAIIGMVIAEKMGIDLQTLAAHQPQAATLLMFPLFHVSGCYSVFLANMIKGGKMVMLSRWDAGTALEFISQEKVTTFPGVPTMFWDLLNHEGLENYDVSSLVSLSVAGQSTPTSLLRSISAAFPNAMLGSGYGMTETNGVICMTHGEEFMQSPDSVGPALAISDIKISSDTGQPTEAGETGEICVRGATIMLGYDNQPDANNKCFKDGWFHTGDIGYLDENDRLFIVDRLTEMIISGGENIYCAEVERVLSQAPNVIETTTFGMPDDRLGERLVALVKLNDGAQETAQDLLDWSATSLASYKVPAELHIISHGLERNATGKVLKSKAKDLYLTMVG
jgi:acyl-CoA synthetase (AMP-forming)/AMP-acid ligase II